jgi:N-acetylneuraminic acid mutarotase
MKPREGLMRLVKSAGLGALVFSVAFSAHNAHAQQAAAGTWAKKAPMRFARSEFQAAAVNGKIYVIGGGRIDVRDGKPFDSYTNGDTDEYDPKTDSWRARTPMPEGGTHNSIAVLDGKIYVAGGFAGRQHTLPTASLYSYDPGTDIWRKLSSLSSPRASISLVALNGKIHAFGGRLMGEETSLATHEVYDPSIDTWTLATPMPSSRDHAGISVVDGKVDLFGGRTGDSDSSVALNEIYDSKTDKWSTAAPMPTARSSGAYAQYRGLLFFMGGECKTTPAGRVTFDENEAYDPKTNRWRKLASLPSGRHGFAAVAIGNTLYVFGGSTACGSGGKVADNLAFVLP